jgi:putative DNA methylase
VTDPFGSDGSRLIEAAFPLRQASIDSLHEKSVRHGHISTLHIWPARRPLAACRAALIATLLSDPGDADERKSLLERLGGRLVERVEIRKVAGKEVEVRREETEGGILHWGRESGPDLGWFRDEIRKAYGGRAPVVLDPFAGGGSIPLEAMRLGCEALAIDLNPVAWFILKCTLEYPHRLSGKTWPLPEFALELPGFAEKFLGTPSATGGPGKGQGKSKADIRGRLQGVQQGLFPLPGAPLAWHVRAWGQWILERAKADLERFYPVIEGQTTVAYLWARTVTCKNCRGELPLLKTRWLCRKPRKKVVLHLETRPGDRMVAFTVRDPASEMAVGGKAAGPGETHGTMTRSGATCPHCGVIATMEDLRQEGCAGRLGQRLVAVVVEGAAGKEYRPATGDEERLAAEAGGCIGAAFEGVPFGVPREPLPGKAALGIRVPLYGLDAWGKLFSPRQLLALGTFARHTRAAIEAMGRLGYPAEWVEAVGGLLALGVDKLADYDAGLSTWHLTGEKITHVFVRFALPMTWDFAELNPLSDSTGNYSACLEWVCRATEHTSAAAAGRPAPRAILGSSTSQSVPPGSVDVVLTDPPYYDAIPYSDTMDFFYVWLRRTTRGLAPAVDTAFSGELAPKWDEAAGDGELIDDDSRFGGDREKSRAAYEDGMLRAFQEGYRVLRPEGRMVVVFAQKNPAAWEAIVSAMLRAGFVVTASWPIQTEMANRTRALTGAALSSSVWLVCRKRPATARPGWDGQVLEEMKANLWGKRDESGRWRQRPTLRDFWDAGIRGPDFVWAATGPALEAYSRYPVVKKADSSSQVMTVGEFLRHVRRLVVDFVVGRVLSPDGDQVAVEALDDVTAYYLLHRHTFRFADTPSGAVILYAVSCGLADRDLADEYDLLTRAGRPATAAGSPPDSDDENAEEEVVEGGSDGESGEAEPAPEGSGTSVRLKAWHERSGKRLGEGTGGKPAPLIDQAHRLMRLWRAGDVAAVDAYIRDQALTANQLFRQLLQALIEMAEPGAQERTLLESISNHISGRRAPEPLQRQTRLENF